MRQCAWVLCKLLLVAMLGYLASTAADEWAATALAAELKAFACASEARVRCASAEPDPALRDELLREVHEEYYRYYASIGR